jgi:hypothetical protein
MPRDGRCVELVKSESRIGSEPQKILDDPEGNQARQHQALAA